MRFLRLKELRIERGYTQKELAEGIQTTADSIYSWEKGRSEPSIETLAKLADFFECSIDYLMGREDDFGNIVLKTNAPNLSQQEQGIIATFRNLPKDLQQRAATYISKLGELAADEKTATADKKNAK